MRIYSSNQQKIEDEVPTTRSTIQRQEDIQPEVEVTIKPPNNIEFNPPVSAKNLSTAIEEGISGTNGPAIAGMYMQKHHVSINRISGSFLSSESYNMVFLTAAILSIVCIAFALILKRRIQNLKVSSVQR
jgi:hypothetical protein